MIYQWASIFPTPDAENLIFFYTQPGSQKPFMVGATDGICDLHAVGAAAAAECLPLFRYDSSGHRVDNITDWALEQFRQHYSSSPNQRGREKPPSPASGRGAGGEGEVERTPAPTHTSPRPPAKLADDSRQYARQMRSHATDAESLIWTLLRSRRLADAKFRRQHPLGRYILDFYCAEHALCIELDGGQHAEHPARDAVRDAWLQAQGVRVLRFWNNQVLAETEAVLEEIYRVLAERDTDLSAVADSPSPLTPLPLAGEGNTVGRTLGGEGNITKQAIFHYCYAVLHDPLYREKYAQNLKREFPHIPFYADFEQWAAWGKALLQLHISYEAVEPFTLQRSDTPDEKARTAGLSPKAMLRADKDAGSIALDSETTLRGIPPAAWDYKLGNRCALEWILDQYKEKKPKDPTIREQFDTYRFADYKEKVIDLLRRVTTVSVETVRIVQAMQGAAR